VSQPYTVQRREYGPLLKVANAALSLLSALKLPIADLDQDAIVRAALRATGRSQVNDETFLEPMAEMMRCVNAAPVTTFGRFSARQLGVKAVTNRLQIEEYQEKHPAVRDAPVRRPLFILGFPRTGTTLLQNLLSTHPQRRALKFWELLTPVPMHDDPEVDRRKRRRFASQILWLSNVIAPEQRFIHEVKLDTPEECWPLFFPTFAVMNIDLQFSLPDYGDWLMKYDMRAAYQVYRSQLQILAEQQPTGQFVLKCPEHLWFLDAILETFPDACIVWTHRDPVASVASYSSLIALNHRLWYGRFENEALGAHIRGRFLNGIDRAMDARERAGREHQFYDVDFQELAADPTAMVGRIAEHFDLNYTAEDAAAVRDWLDNDRSDGRGQHLYSPSQFGLDPAAIHRDYARYIERFNIPLKSY